MLRKKFVLVKCVQFENCPCSVYYVLRLKKKGKLVLDKLVQCTVEHCTGGWGSCSVGSLVAQFSVKGRSESSKLSQLSDSLFYTSAVHCQTWIDRHNGYVLILITLRFIYQENSTNCVFSFGLN